MPYMLSFFLFLFVSVNLSASAESERLNNTPTNIIELGKALFFDTNLSKNRTQSCSTCHDPEHAFTDSRDNQSQRAASLGDDGISFGDRSAPTLTYTSLTPAFQKNADGEYLGGFFHDGRAENIITQVAEPIVNPIEMALSDAADVNYRISENPVYVRAFKNIFSENIFDDADNLYTAVAQSIAAFETSPQFSSFDSKYDRYLSGEYKMTKQEDLGRRFFFSDLINCNSCHLLDLTPTYTRETFSNYLYHNIGTPKNTSVREINGLGSQYRDHGLLNNPAVKADEHKGKFKVPTLRNVSVTAPYMHNGVFKELRTVMLFYSQYMVTNAENQVNPETGNPWGAPEVDENIEFDLLRQRQPLDSYHITAILAFLNTLTDKRYEHLLE
jgi:cytochrome c peroxidase